MMARKQKIGMAETQGNLTVECEMGDRRLGRTRVFLEKIKDAMAERREKLQQRWAGGKPARIARAEKAKRCINWALLTVTANVETLDAAFNGTEPKLDATKLEKKAIRDKTVANTLMSAGWCLFAASCVSHVKHPMWSQVFDVFSSPFLLAGAILRALYMVADRIRFSQLAAQQADEKKTGDGVT